MGFEIIFRYFYMFLFLLIFSESSFSLPLLLENGELQPYLFSINPENKLSLSIFLVNERGRSYVDEGTSTEPLTAALAILLGDEGTSNVYNVYSSYYPLSLIL